LKVRSVFRSGESTTSSANSASRRHEDTQAATQYLLEEYDNVAQAHFKTIDTLSTFFKHYLLIMSVPITVGLALVKVTGLDVTSVGPAVLYFFALVGLAVFGYIVNLRHDTVLYARTINGLRKYFYDRLNVDVATMTRHRVLPQSQYVPRYHEVAYFYPVLVAFTLLDSAYVLAAGFIADGTTADYVPSTGTWWLLAFSVMAHWALYALLAANREGSLPWRKVWFGIDLDGVVNEHRRHFCDTLNVTREDKVLPDDITSIPVHECARLNVEEADEHAVFNTPSYWTDMPAMHGAAKYLRKIKGTLGYKVVAFTYRDWPNDKHLSDVEATETSQAWKAHLKSYIDGGYLSALKARFPGGLMAEATRKWMKKNDFPAVKLYVELGTESSTPVLFKNRNRFRISERKPVRMFVEDEPEKAFKLAYICDVVFLMDQPYNRVLPFDLPRNVIRVHSWQEIYQLAKAMA